MSLTDQNKQAMEVLTRNFAALTGFPGVTGAGVGFRTRNEEVTYEICIYIEVEKKKPISQLLESEVIPSQSEGVGVDVVERPNRIPRLLRLPPDELVDERKYRPLRGGSQVTNGILSNGRVGVGTLGCMVHVPDKKGPFNALLSNYHVLYANGAANGQAIGQPTSSDKVGINRGGKKWKELDFALASLADDVAGSNDVLEIGTLTGWGNAMVGDRVRKYGRTTELTVGQITKVGVWCPTETGFCYFLGLDIMEGYPKIDPVGQFSDEGDSGSVIVNDKNQVVGLLWGGDNKVPDTTFANDQRRLNENAGPFQIPIKNAFQMQQIFSDAPRLKKYAEMLGQTEKGSAVLQALLANVEEGVRLVNQQRECMVTWQRTKGPAFISLKRHLNTDEPYRIERSIDGVTKEKMITKMAAVFRKHGSEKLSTAIEDHIEEMLRCLKQADTVEEFIEALLKR